MLRYTYILNFMKIHSAVFEILHTKDFLQKIKKNLSNKTKINLEKKLKHFSSIVFAYSVHV